MSKPARPRKRVSRDHVEQAVLSAMVLVERYGLDGRPPRSLEEVSRRHSLSRISVRMIEAGMLRALKERPQGVSLPALPPERSSEVARERTTA